LSYSKIFNNQQFVIGVQPGLVYKYFNANGITFGTQFDAINQQFDSRLPSSENGFNQNMYYFDMNVGLLWRTLIQNLTPSAGFSLTHVVRPMETFSSTGIGSRLPIKYTINGQIGIPLNSKFDLTPCFLYSTTAGTNEFLAGAITGYNITGFFIPVKQVYGLTMCRINPLQNIDAIILGTGVKFMKFDLGISYDINVSPLSNATTFNGAFEISLIFTGGKYKVKNINEPCFIY
jgi:type IX secretion system PorP/SprF family membrane protein